MKQLKKELNFELKIKSGDRTIDKLEGDLDKIMKSINKKYNILEDII